MPTEDDMLCGSVQTALCVLHPRMPAKQPETGEMPDHQPEEGGFMNAAHPERSLLDDMHAAAWQLPSNCVASLSASYEVHFYMMR